MGDLREIDAAEITRAVRELCIEINYKVPEDLVAAVERARGSEESPLGRQILDLVLRNAELAAEGEYPYCQDTGSTVVFIDVGQDVHVVGADLTDAIDEGVRTGYKEAYLRASIVGDPIFERKNTGDNTPAFVHTRIVPGDQIRIQVDAKGGGSENKGRHAMLKPSDGIDGVKSFVLQGRRRGRPRRVPAGHHRRRHRRELRVLGDPGQARADAQGRPAEPRPEGRGARGRAVRDCATRSASGRSRSAGPRRSSPCTSR